MVIEAFSSFFYGTRLFRPFNPPLVGMAIEAKPAALDTALRPFNAPLVGMAIEASEILQRT